MNTPKIGRIVGTQGVKGEVVLVHQVQHVNELKNIQALMLELHPNSFIPFFIENIRIISKDECFVKLEEINSLEEAKTINNTNVYAPPNTSIALVQNNKWEGIIGYTIADITHGILGQISEISDSGLQQLFVVKNQEKELLIPLQEKLIKNIDETIKTIFIDLPEGYLEIFSE